MNKKDIQRFQKKIELDLLEGCWLWTSIIQHNGYGRFHFNGKLRQAHRISYEHWNGSIPRGLEIDHLCRNRNCVNPQHLEIVTKTENCSRGRSANAEKTYCKRGHEYTMENTYFDKKGRDCRQCINIRSKKYQRKNMEVETR